MISVFFLSFLLSLSRAAELGFTSSSPSAPESGLSAGEAWSCRLAWTGRATLASALQRCGASTQWPGDICSVRPTSNLKDSGSALADSCKPRRIAYSVGKARPILVDGKVNPAFNGVSDCSHFINSLLCRQGARVNPGDDDCRHINTNEMFTSWGKGSSCFQVPEFTSVQSLRPGCMVLWMQTGATIGHVVMISSAGKDPLGLGENCQAQKNLVNSAFSILESARSSGPQEIEARYKYKNNPKLSGDRAMIALKKLACRARTTGSSVRAEDTFDGLTVRVLCHSGTPECTGVAREFVNESCVRPCL